MVKKIEVQNSRNIASIEYDDERLVMTIVFKNKKGNSKYEYYKVPSSMWDFMERYVQISGNSYGQWVRRYISKKGAYEYKKIV